MFVVLAATPVAGGPREEQARAGAAQAKMPGVLPLMSQIKAASGCWPKHREKFQNGNVWCVPLIDEEFDRNLLPYLEEYRNCTRSSAMTMGTCLKVEVGADGAAAARCVKCERMAEPETGYRWLREVPWTARTAVGPTQPSRSCTCAARIVSRFRFSPGFAGDVFLVPPIVMRGKPSN